MLTHTGEDKTVASLHAIIGRLFVCGLYGDVKVLKVKELRPSATSVCGLKLLVYAALSY